MPLVATRGAASAQGFGEFAVTSTPTYIEDVFSTWLYTGTGASLTITNNIDLSTYGGLVWIKGRSGTTGHRLTDTARGVTKSLASETTAAEATETTGLTAFGTTGFTIGADVNYNTSAATYASWTFRKQAKFFDVLTYIGDGSGAQVISHNLGSVPGCIIIKRTGSTNDWAVYHIGNPFAPSEGLALNLTSGTSSTYHSLNSVPSSTTFTVGSGVNPVNVLNGAYVAYLFAHNAGGFGLTGTDNVISCGSFTTDGSAYANVTLGYEPQWVMCKRTDGVGNWQLNDNMRGMTTYGGQIAQLYPSLSNAEGSGTGGSHPTATGFESTGLGVSQTYIYIAIRRGPMKVPTTGTSVFSPNYQNVSTGTAITTNFPPDLQLYRSTAQSANEGVVVDRLRGVNSTTTANSTPWLDTTTTAAEALATSVTRNWGNTGFQMPGFVATIPSVFYSFRRAPSYMDVVCFIGTGSATTFSHNLAAVPELMIVKRRDIAGAWDSYSSALANTEYIVLNTTAAKATGATRWNSTTPTSSVFSVGTSTTTNASAGTYVAYLFATCAGVSKVGSYNGNTSNIVTVNCGFTSGARFVLIKRTDSTGDWYVYDSTRGITSGNDPYLFLNSTAAEVTSTNYVDTDSTGFKVTATAPAELNATGGTYIFLAIA